MLCTATADSVSQLYEQTYLFIHITQKQLFVEILTEQANFAELGGYTP